MSRIHMTGPGLTTRGSPPSLASSRLSSLSPVLGYQSRPPRSSPTTLTLMGTISLSSWLRYSEPGSKTLYTHTVAVLADQRAMSSRASGITHRWIVPTSPLFMAFMNPTATSVSSCPMRGPPRSWGASASTDGGAEVTELTETTSSVWGTPAEQAASPPSTARTTTARRSRAGRLPTDGDLRDGRRLGLPGGRLAVRRLRLGVDGRQGDGEGGAMADLALDVDRAPVQVHVLERDGQPESGAAEGPGPVHVGAVEALEDVGQVLGRDALALVGDGDDHVTTTPAHPDPDVALDGVLNGVLDQVGEHPVEPAGVGGDQRLALTGVHLETDVDLAAVGDRVERVDHLVEQAAEVDLDRLQVDHAGVEAADLQQVLEQVLEPLQLAFQQHGGPLGIRRQAGPGGVDVVGGHAHRGQWGAQLVADVGDEPGLEAADVLQLADLLGQVVGHAVERLGQLAEVVLAGRFGDAGGQVAGRDLLGHVPGPLDRLEHPADGDRGQDHHRRQQPGAHDQQEVGELGERLLLEVQRIEEVGLLDADLGLVDVDGGADDQHAAGAKGRADVGVGQLAVLGDPADQVGGDVVEAEVVVGGLLGPVLALQDQGLEAGLAAGAGGQPLLQPGLDLGGGQAGDLTQVVLPGELEDLLDRVVVLLGVEGLGQQRIQGRA